MADDQPSYHQETFPPHGALDADAIDPVVRQRYIDYRSWNRDPDVKQLPDNTDAFDQTRYARDYGDSGWRAIDVGDPYGVDTPRDWSRRFGSASRDPSKWLDEKDQAKRPISAGDTDYLRRGQLVANTMPGSYSRFDPRRTTLNRGPEEYDVAGMAYPPPRGAGSAVSGPVWLDSRSSSGMHPQDVGHELQHLGYFDTVRTPQGRELMVEMDKKFITPEDLRQQLDLHEMLVRSNMQRNFGPDVEGKIPYYEDKPGTKTSFGGAFYQIKRAQELNRDPEWQAYMRKLDRLQHEQAAGRAIEKQGGVFARGGKVTSGVAPTTNAGTNTGTNTIDEMGGISYRAGGRVRVALRKPRLPHNYRAGGLVPPMPDDDGGAGEWHGPYRPNPREKLLHREPEQGEAHYQDRLEHEWPWSDTYEEVVPQWMQPRDENGLEPRDELQDNLQQERGQRHKLRRYQQGGEVRPQMEDPDYDFYPGVEDDYPAYRPADPLQDQVDRGERRVRRQNFEHGMAFEMGPKGTPGRADEQARRGGKTVEDQLEEEAERDRHQKLLDQSRQRFQEGGVVGPEFDATHYWNTPLDPDEEDRFQQWAASNGRARDLYDYDMRGAWKEGISADPQTQHWPDTYKKPNHPTFSQESIYHGSEGHRGGRWDHDETGSETLQPYDRRFDPRADELDDRDYRRQINRGTLQSRTEQLDADLRDIAQTRRRFNPDDPYSPYRQGGASEDEKIRRRTAADPAEAFAHPTYQQWAEIIAQRKAARRAPDQRFEKGGKISGPPGRSRAIAASRLRSLGAARP